MVSFICIKEIDSVVSFDELTTENDF